MSIQLTLCKSICLAMVALSCQCEPFSGSEQYLSKVQTKILKAWTRPDKPTPKKAVVLFRLLSSGEAKGVKLQRSSGSEDCDREAIDSITKASPFDPLPPDALPEFEIQFTFDSDSKQK